MITKTQTPEPRRKLKRKVQKSVGDSSHLNTMNETPEIFGPEPFLSSATSVTALTRSKTLCRQ